MNRTIDDSISDFDLKAQEEEFNEELFNEECNKV